MAELQLIVASYTDAAEAEVSRARLTAQRTASHVFPKVPGWLGRRFGRHDRFLLGVAPQDVARARVVLREAVEHECRIHWRGP